MKIYTQDRGCYGCIVVIAENLDDAIKMMKDYYNYNPNHTISPVTEEDIVVGWAFCNLGDS